MATRNEPVRWGVLGTAKIAVTKVIPAMQKGSLSRVMAIASRDPAKASEAAVRLGIPRSYGAYEELLADPDIEAVYIPLPNHLHVPWSARALDAGKHVLCEKPVSLNAAELRRLISARDRNGLLAGEAFMVHTHPQWLRVRELIASGVIGELRSIAGFFSYFLTDPANVRNVPEWGGGGLMDIGCYPIHTSRFLFGEEPRRVFGLLDFDPEMRVDRLASVILDYPVGQCVFQCGTQMTPYQRMQFFGSKGRIELEIPFNAPPDRPCRIRIDDGGDLFGRSTRVEEIAVCDQYTIQGDEFSRAVRQGTPVPVPLENSLGNMAVIDAIARSAQTGRWERPLIP
jgi:predicted dehydrogenase